MNGDPMKHQDSFSTIRATIEAEVAAPGILSISSARPGDGKTAVAAGIARSLAAAGYRTLALDATGATEETLAAKLGAPEPPAIVIGAAEQHFSAGVRMTPGGCDVLALASGEGNVPSALSIAALFAAVRASYDYVVVDSAAVAEGGATFARCADGVVLAVREGRPADPSDAEAVALLDRVRARFLGVVATMQATHVRHPLTETSGAESLAQVPRNALSRLRELFFTTAPENRGAAVGTTTPD